MSKDLVVPAGKTVDFTGSDQVVFFEGDKKLEFSVEGGRGWFDRLSRGEGRYSPLTNIALLDRHVERVHGSHNKRSLRSIVVSVPASFGAVIVLSAPLEVVLTLLADSMVAAMAAQFMFPIFAVVSGFIFGPVIDLKTFYGRSSFYQEYLRMNKGVEAINKINYEALRVWLEARYDIEVSENVLNSLSGAVQSNAVAPRQFVDVLGKAWSFVRGSDEAGGWFVEEVRADVERDAAGSLAIEPVLHSQESATLSS